MDDIVKAALAKWPNVPACHGWLGLDTRGQWHMRDDRVQAAGPFPQSKGSVLRHDKLIAFIQRNYAADAEGQWYFQNGPQRVYVELENTPWIWRLMPDGSVQTSAGEPVQVSASLLDEEGRLYLVTERGVGLVHTADMAWKTLPSRKTKSRSSGRNLRPSGNSAGGPSLTVVGAS